MKCAAFELPFDEAEEYGPDTLDLLELLADEAVLVKAGGRYHWMTDAFPADQSFPR